MPRQLLLATRNRGKIRELMQLFADLPDLQVLSLDAVPELPEVIEDGDSFEHNARKKALEIARATAMLVLSDDSGLEVDALDGRPGVRAPRDAHQRASDAENNQRLVSELRDVPQERRTARYRVVLALADPQGALGDGVHFEEGICEGSICLEPRGDHGFGYDPYFQPRGYDRSMAELPPQEKNGISHRALASKKMRAFLASYLRGSAT